MFDFASRGEQGHDGDPVTLEWRGSPPRAGFRAGLGIVGAVLFLLSAFLVVRGFQLREWPLLLLPALLVYLVWRFSTTARYWSRVSWIPAARVIELTESARHFLVGSRTVRLPYDRIVGARFEAELRAPGVTRVGWRFQQTGATRLLDIHLPVRDLDRREEAFDLFHRSARAMGFTAYEVQRSDPRGFVLLPVRCPRPGRTRPIPEIAHGPEYARFRSEPPAAPEPESFAEPDEKPAPFRPAGWFDHFQVLAWQPGKRIHLRTRPTGLADLPAIVLGSLFFAATLCFGLGYLAYFLLYGAENVAHLGTWLQFSGLATIVVTVVFAVRWSNIEPWEAVLDWKNKDMRFRRGNRRRRVPFSVAERVVLSGSWQNVRGGRDRFWCTLHLVLPGQDEVLFVTREDGRGPDDPFRATLPAAIELARALGVPWQWEDYPEGVYAGIRPAHDRSRGAGEEAPPSRAAAEAGGDLRTLALQLTLTVLLLGGLIVAAAGWDYGGPYAVGFAFVALITGGLMAAHGRRP